MAATRELRLVLVTPEKTLLDEEVAALRLPLYDGQIGILPGRAPAIGRLGFGELHITKLDGREERYFVDGGFVQVLANVVSVLTNRAIPVAQLDRAAAERELQEALARDASTDADIDARTRDQQRARSMISLAASR